MTLGAHLIDICQMRMIVILTLFVVCLLASYQMWSGRGCRVLGDWRLQIGLSMLPLDLMCESWLGVLGQVGGSHCGL